jgi:hypothetical protein
VRLYFIGSIPGHKPETGQTPTQEHQELFTAATELGFAAARRGHTILVGSESVNTIDYYIMEGVRQYIQQNPTQQVFIEIHRPEGTPAPYTNVLENIRISRISYPQDPTQPYKWVIAHVRALDSCDAVITLGGGNSTRIVGTIAADRQIPRRETRA